MKVLIINNLFKRLIGHWFIIPIYSWWGTAGCAVASRLSENGRHSVLLLEYGDFPNPWLEVPALFGEFLNDENRKIYRSVPQSDGSLSNNGVSVIIICFSYFSIHLLFSFN